MTTAKCTMETNRMKVFHNLHVNRCLSGKYSAWVLSGWNKKPLGYCHPWWKYNYLKDCSAYKNVDYKCCFKHQETQLNKQWNLMWILRYQRILYFDSCFSFTESAGIYNNLHTDRYCTNKESINSWYNIKGVTAQLLRVQFYIVKGHMGLFCTMCINFME